MSHYWLFAPVSVCTKPFCVTLTPIISSRCMRSVVAHTLKRGDEPTGSPDASIRLATVLVTNVSDEHGWRNIEAGLLKVDGNASKPREFTMHKNPRPEESASPSRLGDDLTSWVYATRPPKIPRTRLAMNVHKDIPAWGTAYRIDEMVETNDLPEFVSGIPKPASTLMPSTILVSGASSPEKPQDLSNKRSIGCSPRKRSRTPDPDTPAKLARTSGGPKKRHPPILAQHPSYPNDILEDTRIKNRRYVSARLFISSVRCAHYCRVCNLLMEVRPLQPYSKSWPTTRNLKPLRADIMNRIKEFEPFQEVNQPATVSALSIFNPPSPPVRWNGPNAYGAWIIPVNGTSFHPRASSGRLARENAVELSSDRDANFARTIHWTGPGLIMLWNNIVTIRKAGTLGPIGISLESQIDCSGRGLGEGHPPPVAEAIHSRTSQANVAALPSNEPQEWLKIRCEGKYALRIRTLLGQIRPHRSQVGDKVNSGNAKILEAATLLYVDQLGTPILLA
ncbi:hypothetical protein DL93DRAFT_55954 [Clavulina sp. PMI_390]|nr:hypothetical protein DL93DRAFT_55954 [Clavulina sp. PMI_390]